jgi:hypothetical protein
MKHFQGFNQFHLLNEDNNSFFKKQIIDAYLWIRKNNNTIPDEVLDFMEEAALEKLAKGDRPKAKISDEDKKEFIDYCDEYYGKDGMFNEIFKGGLTKKELTNYFNGFINTYKMEFTGDTVDRENFRDYILSIWKK